MAAMSTPASHRTSNSHLPLSSGLNIQTTTPRIGLDHDGASIESKSVNGFSERSRATSAGSRRYPSTCHKNVNKVVKLFFFT